MNGTQTQPALDRDYGYAKSRAVAFDFEVMPGMPGRPSRWCAVFRWIGKDGSFIDRTIEG